MKMWYHSHLCGCFFSNVPIHTSDVSPRRSNDGIISRFNIVGERFLVVDHVYRDYDTQWRDANLSTVSNNFTLYARIDVQQHISMVTHISNILRLVQYQFHLYDWSWSNVMIQPIVGFHRRHNIMMIFLFQFLAVIC